LFEISREWEKAPGQNAIWLDGKRGAKETETHDEARGRKRGDRIKKKKKRENLTQQLENEVKQQGLEKAKEEVQKRVV